LDPSSTAWGLAAGLSFLLIFWSARAAFERDGGLRRIARAVSLAGLLLAGIVFVQRALSPDLIYGFWRPIARIDHPHPIGPFLNRNDLATWLIMAIPATIGYVLARIEARRLTDERPTPLEKLLDSRMVWLAGSIVLMFAALLASLSRSGLLGAATGLVIMLSAGRRRMSRTSVGWMVAAAATSIAAATAYANLAVIAERVGDAFSTERGGRVAVWRETWPMARDFPVAGIGVGAFERGMSLYQQSSRLLFFNHAHNEYLQILVEGGALLAAPAGVALAAALLGVRRRLKNDRSPTFWLRLGAASALASVAVQSIWDTGLRMPANAVLFATLAAMALHDTREPRTDRPSSTPRYPSARIAA